MDARDRRRSYRPDRGAPKAAGSGPGPSSGRSSEPVASPRPRHPAGSAERAAPRRSRHRGQSPAGEFAGRRAAQSGQVSAAIIPTAPRSRSHPTPRPVLSGWDSRGERYRAGPSFSPPGRRRGCGSRRRPGRRRRRSPRSPRAGAGRSGPGGGGRRRGHSLGGPQPIGDLRVRAGPRVAGQHGDQLRELGRPARVVVLAAEPLDDPAQEGQGPGPVEDPLRGQLMGGLSGVPAFGVEGVDGERVPPSAPLGRILPVAPVRQVAGADGAEERAESAPGRDRPWR